MYNCTLNIIVMGCKKSFLDNSKLLITIYRLFRYFRNKELYIKKRFVKIIEKYCGELSKILL